jgi:hypothetical protein
MIGLIEQRLCTKFLEQSPQSTPLICQYQVKASQSNLAVLGIKAQFPRILLTLCGEECFLCRLTGRFMPLVMENMVSVKTISQAVL